MDHGFSHQARVTPQRKATGPLYTIKSPSRLQSSHWKHSREVFTSPKAPRPITFRDSKSSRPSRVRLRRRNSVSFLACWERRMRFCRDRDAQLSTIHSSTGLHRASESNSWSQEHWKGLGRYHYTVQLTRTKLHTGNSVHWTCTHLFVSQPFLIHHFLQLLLPGRKFDRDKCQTAAPQKPFLKKK